MLPQCPNLVQWYGANQGNQQVISYLISAQRNCGTRSIRRNPLVCCDRPTSTNVRPQTEAPFTQGPPDEQPTTRPPPPSTTTTTTTTPTPPPRTLPANQNSAGEQCYDPKGRDGVCRNIRECPHILREFVSRQGDPVYIQYIKESNGLCNYVQPNICCTQEEAPTTAPKSTVIKGRLLTPEEGCGYSNTTLPRVVGGQPAKKGAVSVDTNLDNKII